MMFDVTVHRSFSGAHFLRRYKGDCERVHGHNWKVEVTLWGQELDEGGMLYDFSLLKEHLDKALKPLDHRDLNEVPPFDTIEPSAEEIARYVTGAVAGKLDESAKGRLSSITVKVWETEINRASYHAALDGLGEAEEGESHGI